MDSNSKGDLPVKEVRPASMAHKKRRTSKNLIFPSNELDGSTGGEKNQ